MHMSPPHEFEAEGGYRANEQDDQTAEDESIAGIAQHCAHEDVDETLKPRPSAAALAMPSSSSTKTTTTSPVYLFRSKLPDIDIPDHMALPDFCLENSRRLGEKTCLVVANRQKSGDDANGRRKGGSSGSDSNSRGGSAAKKAARAAATRNEEKCRNGGGEEKWSYREVAEGTERVAEGLAALLEGSGGGGKGKGRVIMLMLPNSAEFVVVFLGAAAAGAVVTACNPSYTPREVHQILATSRPSLILTLSSHIPTLSLAFRLLLLPPQSLHHSSDSSSSFRVILVDPHLAPSPPPIPASSQHYCFPQVQLQQLEGVDMDLPPFHSLLHFSSLLNFDVSQSWSSNRTSNILRMREQQPEDVVALPFSSGTTGLPKAVMLTHRGLVTSIAQQVDGENPNMYFTEDDVVLCVLPMFHIYSLSILLCCLRKGSTILIMPKFEIQTFLELVQRHRVTIAPLVPPIVFALTRNPMVPHYDLSSIRMIMCGAAPLNKDLEDSLRARVPQAIIAQGYGMTEAGSVLSMSLAFAKYPFPVKSGSCGTIIRNAVVKLIDPTTGESVSRNQPGEICIKGNQIMKGYLDDNDATSNAIDEDGFLHTGDVGMIDDDDELFIVDRVKEMIKFKGFQVPPAELEGILLSHPHVHDVACVGMKDEVAGEVPLAFVVPTKEVGVTENELKDFVANQVVYYKKLHRIIFVENIPKSPSGKILRKELRQRLEAEIQCTL